MSRMLEDTKGNNVEVSPSRLEELAGIYDRASKQQKNIIDGPFDCVTINLRPETLAETSNLLRAMQTLVEQARKPFVG